MPTTPTRLAAGDRYPLCRLGAGQCPQQRRGACGCPPQSDRNRTSRGAVGRQPVHAGEGVNKRVLMGTLHPPTQPTWGQIHLVIIAEVKQVGHDGLQGHLALSLLPPGHLWFNTSPLPPQSRAGWACWWRIWTSPTHIGVGIVTVGSQEDLPHLLHAAQQQWHTGLVRSKSMGGSTGRGAQGIDCEDQSREGPQGSV